jgi:hypothetical protein
MPVAFFSIDTQYLAAHFLRSGHVGEHFLDSRHHEPTLLIVNRDNLINAVTVFYLQMQGQAASAQYDRPGHAATSTGKMRARSQR